MKKHKCINCGFTEIRLPRLPPIKNGDRLVVSDDVWQLHSSPQVNTIYNTIEVPKKGKLAKTLIPSNGTYNHTKEFRKGYRRSFWYAILKIFNLHKR